jgi:Helicase conserved C-terminal domain
MLGAIGRWSSSCLSLATKFERNEGRNVGSPVADHLAADFDQLLPQTGSRAPQKTDRARPVAHFQRGKVPLFLISLEAGGSGINLTAADTVIHCDPLWNPAVEDQATDCPPHRPGQAALCLQARRPGHSRRAHAPIAAAQESLAAGTYEAGG